MHLGVLGKEPTTVQGCADRLTGVQSGLGIGEVRYLCAGWGRTGPSAWGRVVVQNDPSAGASSSGQGG